MLLLDATLKHAKGISEIGLICFPLDAALIFNLVQLTKLKHNSSHISRDLASSCSYLIDLCPDMKYVLWGNCVVDIDPRISLGADNRLVVLGRHPVDDFERR